MRLSIRQATLQDVDVVFDILREAAAWLEQRGMPLWRQDELQLNSISARVRSGLFFLPGVRRRTCRDDQVSARRQTVLARCAAGRLGVHSPSGGEKTLCRRRGFLGSAPLGHRPYAHARPALSPLGLHSLTTAIASAL